MSMFRFFVYPELRPHPVAASGSVFGASPHLLNDAPCLEVGDIFAATDDFPDQFFGMLPQGRCAEGIHRYRDAVEGERFQHLCDVGAIVHFHG